MEGGYHGYLLFDSWAGRTRVFVEVVGDTPKRTRVRLMEDCKLPGRNRWGRAGDVILVPKDAVK